MADAEVVIVSQDGTEHVFPPGFDPKKAALIVKGSSDGPKFGDPSLHPTIGAVTEDQQPTWKDNLGEMLKPLAQPTTVSDIAHLVLAPVDATRGASSVLPLATKAGGRGATATGLALERAGNSEAAKMAGGAGTVAELMRGDLRGAAAAALASPALTASGKALQTLGRIMQGVPGTEGMVNDLYAAATNPSKTAALNAWEKQFIASIDTQIQNGTNLSGAQKALVNRIYMRVKP